MKKDEDEIRERLHVSAVKIENAIEDRDEAITDALLVGIPVNEIAREVGLTRQRVWQIGRAQAPVRLG